MCQMGLSYGSSANRSAERASGNLRRTIVQERDAKTAPNQLHSRMFLVFRGKDIPFHEAWESKRQRMTPKNGRGVALACTVGPSPPKGWWAVSGTGGGERERGWDESNSWLGGGSRWA